MDQLVKIARANGGSVDFNIDVNINGKKDSMDKLKKAIEEYETDNEKGIEVPESNQFKKVMDQVGGVVGQSINQAIAQFNAQKQQNKKRKPFETNLVIKRDSH